jgi:thiol-disulfide isomerase/thioredoxin
MSHPSWRAASGACLVAAFLCAADYAAAQDLNIGSKAPPISVEEWIKGDRVDAFQPGKTYVVEFWATWCGPCKAAIPHLTETQKNYTGKIAVLGIASSERDPKEIEDPAQKKQAKRSNLVKFVEDKGAEMGYAVAYDEDRSMAKAWMDPAGQGGIPCTFIVDGTGTVAWIGHPMKMDEPLAQIVSGKWDIKAAAAKAKADRETAAKSRAVYAKLDEHMKAERWADALATLDEMIASDASMNEKMGGTRFQLLLKTAAYDKAYAYGTTLAEGVYAKNGQMLNTMAWFVVDPEAKPAIAKKDLKFALMCAERAAELTKGDKLEPAVLDTLGLVLFESGDVARAITVQERAVELAKGTDMEAELKGRLEQFKKSRQP